MSPPLDYPISISTHAFGSEDAPLVSISCITYNHAPYIRMALDGFLNQKTTFPVEILVHDDASDDGTAGIVKDYEEKFGSVVFPVCQSENQYSRGVRRISLHFNFPRARGKYIAMCEGDDYWIDPLKLQKQVEFLEKNPDFVMCFHDVYLREQDTLRENAESFGREDRTFAQEELFYAGGYLAPTASLVFRRSALEDLPVWLMESPVGDMPLKLILSQRGKIQYFAERMAVRRVSVPGSWNERVRKDPRREFEYHVAMIKMLDNFNAYSNERYGCDILQKQYYYQQQTVPFLGLIKKLKIWMSGKYSPLAPDRSFWGVVKFHLLFLFPTLKKIRESL